VRQLDIKVLNVSSCLFKYICFTVEMYFTMWWRRDCRQCHYCSNLQVIRQADVYVVMWFNLLSLPVLYVPPGLTHCGRVTQICVFTLQLCKTD